MKRAPSRLRAKRQARSSWLRRCVQALAAGVLAGLAPLGASGQEPSAEATTPVDTQLQPLPAVVPGDVMESGEYGYAPLDGYRERWPGCIQRGLLLPGGWVPPPDPTMFDGYGGELGLSVTGGDFAAANLGATAGVSVGGSAALPFLMGDVGYACGTLRFSNSFASLAHPAWGCSRLNLAENGSPIPQDRIFVDYRHFHSVVGTDVFSNPQIGVDNSAILDVNRFVFGFEKKFFNDLMSFEVRLPFNYQIASDIEINQTQTTDPSRYPNVSGVPITSQAFQLGNVGLSFKGILYEDCVVTVTGGMGVKLPTAPDVTISANVNDTKFRIYDPSFPGATPADQYIEVPANLKIRAMVANESVDLVPFLALAYRPTQRMFAQSMLQINIPVNPTRGTLGVAGSLNGAPIGSFPPGNPGDPVNGGIADSASLSWQTLLRLNAQLGYWLYTNPSGRLSAVAAYVEANWSTALNDADRLGPITLLPAIPGTLPSPLTLDLGNEANRVDIVNIGAGMEFELGRWAIAPGAVVPVTVGDNKPFDYEVDLRINRRF
ncbi:MAG: hypothetical protein U0935_15095 [Pirellulales bacterium]